jgi:hypothetical protein
VTWSGVGTLVYWGVRVAEPIVPLVKNGLSFLGFLSFLVRRLVFVFECLGS